MAYADDDLSQHDGEPIELYKFQAPTRGYFFTSWIQSVSYLGDVYEAIPLQRNRLESVSQEDVPALRIELPAARQMVQDFAFGIAPNQLELTVFRRHGLAGDTITYWKGPVLSISVKGRIAEVIVPSTFGNALQSSIPSVYYQTPCNHVLYDTRCALARSSFKTTATVLTVNALDPRRVTVSTVDSQPDGHFKAGDIVRLADGERRLIVAQGGTLLTLNFPFRVLLPGDAVEFFAGCDHTPATCRDKFANIVNFGGHPFIPDQNVFETGVK